MFNLVSNKKKIEEGSCYAVLGGDYIGEIFVFFKEKNKTLFFVSIPKMEIREVSIDKFELGIDDGILDFVNVLPDDVYSVVESHGKKILEA